MGFSFPSFFAHKQKCNFDAPINSYLIITDANPTKIQGDTFV